MYFQYTDEHLNNLNQITGGKLDFCFKFLIISFRKTIIFLKNI